MNRAQLIVENKELRQELLLLRQEMDQLRRMIFGNTRERFVPDQNPQQLSLFEQTETLDAASPITTQHLAYDRKVAKKHPGRTDLPEHLPVEEVIIEPVEDTTGMKRIGEEITETLEYTPASLIRKRTIRPKYAKPDGEGVVIGKLPSRPIPKCIAEASLLAHISVAKFIDHLPFYRQIQRFKREYRWEVSDSTINEWFVAICTLLHPLYEVLQRKVISNGYLQVDESPIKVLDQDKPGGTHQGYQWVYYSPELNLVFFNYRRGRGQHGPKEILASYQGVLQTDGWQVYDKFAEIPGIALAGCLAHARRYFDKSRQSQKVKSEEALTLIQRIYAQERIRKEVPSAEQTHFRKNHIKPIYEELYTWLQKELKADITPKSDYGQALTYLSKQWHKLIKVLEDDRIELDNNLIEKYPPD